MAGYNKLNKEQLDNELRIAQETVKRIEEIRKRNTVANEQEKQIKIIELMEEKTDANKLKTKLLEILDVCQRCKPYLEELREVNKTILNLKKQISTLKGLKFQSQPTNNSE